MSSILVSTAEAISNALNAHTFAYFTPPDVMASTWDYDNRRDDASLVAEQLDVCVSVPRTVEEAIRFSRGEMRYTAAYDIDVRFKFGATSQGANSPLIGKNEITKLVTLVEDIHQFFFDHPTFGPGESIQWFAKENEIGVESKVLVVYSPKFLREKRLFHGILREYCGVTR